MSIQRYQFTKKHPNKDCYRTTHYPKFPRKSTDLYIFSREGDRLDNLSNEFYEDPRYWWVIAEANGLAHGTLNIPAGQQIRIPMPIEELTTELQAAEDNK